MTGLFARVLLALLVFAPAASAHSSSNSYLAVDVAGDTLDVQWSIALRDLDYAVGLDSNGDGAITWGEVRQHAAAIDAYALARLGFAADGADCAIGAPEHLADQLSDGGYVVLRLPVACPAPPHRLTVRYGLLFDLDPQHRGLLRLTMDGVTHAAALSPAQPRAGFEAKANVGATFQEFFVAGVAHLLGGADHLLFVAMLLVPAMFSRREGPTARLSHWTAVPSFGPAFLETVKVLSAFTLAHALTLTSAVLGYVHAPAATIDALIAATIVATALDNVWHLLPGRRWVLAFCFGLVHGFGYASTLGPLQLPPLALATALLSFNLGLEAAQLLVAAVLFPIGFLARNTATYRRHLLPGLSGAAALLAFVWLTDRATGVQLLPF